MQGLGDDEMGWNGSFVCSEMDRMRVLCVVRWEVCELQDSCLPPDRVSAYPIRDKKRNRDIYPALETAIRRAHTWGFRGTSESTTRVLCEQSGRNDKRGQDVYLTSIRRERCESPSVVR